MDPMLKTVIITGIVELMAVPVIVFLIKRAISKGLDRFDAARIAQAETERKETERREAEHTIILAMSRTMLLNNWEKCMDKGCYTVEEREVYHKLYEAYKDDGGNSVIEDIAPRIRALPMEPPRDKEG